MDNLVNGPIPILPIFHSNILLGQHEIYCALKHMRDTPCTKQEDFEKLADIYSQLCDLTEKIEKESAEEGGRTNAAR